MLIIWNEFTGYLGSDLIDAGAGIDSISAEDGNDTVISGAGADTITLGDGNDNIKVNTLEDSSYSTGVDIINDFVQGEDKIDIFGLDIVDISQLYIYNGGTYTEISYYDFAIGFNGSYTFTNADFVFRPSFVTGSNNADSPLNGTAANDVINGLSGNDDIFAGNGNDTLISGEGDDYLVLGNGNDIIEITSTIDSGYTHGVDYVGDFVQGQDKIDVSALGIVDVSQFFTYNGGTYTEISYYDFAIGFNGDYTFTNADFIFAESIINGTNNADSPLDGTIANDRINGLAGNDDIFGYEGNDTIAGGAGGDYIALGAGNDVLLYTSLSDSSAANGADYIGDFVQGQDKIDVSALGFTNISDFATFSSATYSEISNSDFTIGFNGNYTFTNSDFIFA